MTDKPDQTAPLDKPMSEWTDAQVRGYVDNHVVMALQGAEQIMFGDRQRAEDYVRDRLVAVSDTFPDADALDRERRRASSERILRAIRG